MEEEKKRARGSSVTKTIIVLYIAFFAVWCGGAALGEMWPGAAQPALWGMPLWFTVSCVISFLGVSAALADFVRGWLR